MSEHSMVSARASVMVYSDADKKWLPSGTSSGLSKVSIYHHPGNNTFRVVGRKLQDMEVVVNCSIFKSLKYNQATPTFHQWRDNRQVYGLNFANKDDADNFAQAMYTALDTLNAAPAVISQPAVAPNNIQMVSQSMSAAVDQSAVGTGNWTAVNGHEWSRPNSRDSSHGHYQNATADCGGIGQQYADTSGKTGLSPQPNQELNGITADDVMSRSSGANLQPFTIKAPSGFDSSSSSSSSNTSSGAPPSPTPTGTSSQAQAPPPPAPPAPPLMKAPVAPPAPPPAPPLIKAPTPPPAPPMVAAAAAPPAPPPPPAPPAPPLNVGGLAAALQNAQLRKVTPKSPEVKEKEELSLTANHAVHSVTLGRSATTVGASSNSDIMSEMARRLRERRAKAEGTFPDGDDAPPATTGSGNVGPKVPEKTVKMGAATCVNGTDSPKVDRSKRFQSLTGQETFHLPSTTAATTTSATTTTTTANPSRTATGAELDTWKQELLLEVRREIQSVKMEIIEAIRSELSKR